MTMEQRTVRLQEAQIAQSREVLARAFFDDPMTVYMMPDDEHRRSILPAFMEAGQRFCLPHGEVHTTPGEVLGAANWLPPGHTELGEEQLAAAGAFEVLERMGEEGAGRFSALMERMGELHAKAVPPEHWYLLILGVEPERQGQGIGGRLMEPILRRADAEGRACYLETMKPGNVTFYAKHGFEVVVEDDTPDGKLHFWTMRRDPRR